MIWYDMDTRICIYKYSLVGCDFGYANNFRCRSTWKSAAFVRFSLKFRAILAIVQCSTEFEWIFRKRLTCRDTLLDGIETVLEHDTYYIYTYLRNKSICYWTQMKHNTLCCTLFSIFYNWNYKLSIFLFFSIWTYWNIFYFYWANSNF